MKVLTVFGTRPEAIKMCPLVLEMNRLLTGRIAAYHFAPTKRNEENLLKENVAKNIFITGNTVIDAFKTTVKDEKTLGNHWRTSARRSKG